MVSPKCPKCGGSDLQRVKGSRYLCRGCGYEFYACPACGEAFEQKWQLASHMRKHRGVEEREMMEELRALRALLEEALAGQKLILAKLGELLEMQKKVLELLSSANPTPAREPPGELPSFLRDNPWLRMLEERAGGEG